MWISAGRAFLAEGASSKALLEVGICVVCLRNSVEGHGGCIAVDEFIMIKG